MKIIRFYFIIAILIASIGGLKAQSALALVESTGGCGPAISDCDAAVSVICYDVMLTPDPTYPETTVLGSYTLVVSYPLLALSFLSEAPCSTDQGNPRNLEEEGGIGSYIISGVNGTQVVTPGVAVAIHTVCFTIVNESVLNGSEVTVGGSLFGAVLSALAYENPVNSEPDVPAFPFTASPSNSSCLPIELISFQAKRDYEKVNLTWRTASEINNDRFDIETSVDGSNFTKIDEVEGHGTTSSITDYKYVHNHPVKGLNYYRLKQIDFDGKSEFTPIRSVQFNNEATKGGLNVRYFPNPIVDQLSITTDTDISGARLVVSDLHGRSILTRDYTSGMIVSLADYGSGVYLVRLIDQSDTVLSTSRIILQ